MCRPNRRQVNFTEGLVAESEVTYTPCNIVHWSLTNVCLKNNNASIPRWWKKTWDRSNTPADSWAVLMFLSIEILFVQLRTSCTPFSLTQSGNCLTSLVVYLVLFRSEGPGDRGSADPKICYIIEFLHTDCFLDKLAPWLSPGVALCGKAAACIIRIICRLYVNCRPSSKQYPLWRWIVIWWPISCNLLTKNLECHSSIVPHYQIPANSVPFCLQLVNLLGIIAFVLPEQIDVHHAASSF
jgi:hypothetical protein